MRHFLIRLFTGTVLVAGSLGLTTVAANAAPPPIRPHATPQCLATPNCVTPDVFGTGSDTPAELALTSPAFEAGLPLGGTPVVVDEGDNSSAAQDWQFIDQGDVTDLYNGGEGPAFRLTAYDNVHYGPDNVFALEFTPDGNSSGYCVANINRKLVLRKCSGLRWQQFIQAESNTAFTASDGAFYLSILQATVTGHHRAVTNLNGNPDVQLTIQTIGNNGRNQQDWDTENPVS